MRTIVIGTTQVQNNLKTVNLWFRIAVPAARQPYYAKLQAAYQPLAPGDYSGADAAEIQAFQQGQFVERAMLSDMIDPAATQAQVQARLVSLYNTATTQFVADDTSHLQFYGSFYDGTSWTMKSS